MFEHYDASIFYKLRHVSAAADRNGGGASPSRANPLALLTAAAAVAINPVLVTVSVTGKRRR